MAIRPDYDIGEMTLSSGSADFTTSGSSLQTASVQAGDAIITPSGHVLIIASITGQNSGTLFLPCPAAAAGTDLPLRIRFQPDGSRYQGAVRVLIDLLSSGNIEAFAALVGAAGMVPIFTGPGTLDLADPATFGIQDPNGSLAKLAAQTLDASSKYVQGDGTLQAKAELPISNPTQTALNNKLSVVPGSQNTIRFLNLDNFDAKSGLYIKSSRPNTAIGQTNYSGSVDFSLGSPSARASVSLFERIGTEMVLSFNVQSGSTQQWFEMTHNGDFRVPGAITAGSKSFKIDHVKDPYNKYLVYMSTEAPKAGIEDWGRVRLVNGQAEVDLDIAAGQMQGTFAALTQRAIVVSVNNLDSHTRVRAGRITDGKFTIFADDPECDDEVTWHVKAERADPFIKSHPYCDPVTGLLIAEHEKED